MIEGSIKIQSLQADITQVKAHSKHQSLAYASSNKNQSSPLFNKHENQIIDDVNISDSALKQLENIQILNKQLQKYINYLKGNNDNNKVKIVPDDNRKEAIAAKATSFDASITAGKIIEKTLDIDFKLNDDGSLNELTVSTSETTTEFVNAKFTLSDTQFYAYQE